MNMQAFDWAVARGAGFSAFVLLTASVVLGLVLSLRLTSPRWPAIVTNDVHRFITNLALWMTGLHLMMLLLDSQSGFSLGELLIPFAGEYRPVATSLGILALYAVLAVMITTKLRHRMGYRRWRQLHGLGFVAYGAALLHGILAGTDSGAGWATLVYVASGLAVAGLTTARILRRPGRPSPATSRPPATPGPPTEAHAPHALPPLRPRAQVGPPVRR
jgi:sulfoxide reductase heme-binding subunit YedZ